ISIGWRARSCGSKDWSWPRMCKPTTDVPPSASSVAGVSDPGSSNVLVGKNVLEKNARLGEANRGWLADRGVLALNLVSSPGAGKTALLERTVRDLGRELALSVIEGDQETDYDARRIQAAGGRAVQLNTGRGCHLDAAM